MSEKSKKEELLENAVSLIIQNPSLCPQKIGHLLAKLNNIKSHVTRLEEENKGYQNKIMQNNQSITMMMGAFNMIMELINDSLTEDEMKEIINNGRAKDGGLPG